MCGVNRFHFLDCALKRYQHREKEQARRQNLHCLVSQSDESQCRNAMVCSAEVRVVRRLRAECDGLVVEARGSTKQPLRRTLTIYGT